MQLSLSLGAIAAVLFAWFPMRVQAEATTVQAVVRLPNVEAAIDLTCVPQQECIIHISSFRMELSLGQSAAGVRVADEDPDLVFFDETSRTSISYKNSPTYLNVYDPTSDGFVTNGHNSPIGSIELMVSDKQ